MSPVRGIRAISVGFGALLLAGLTTRGAIFTLGGSQVAVK
jgi:hypothetical protein